MSAADHAVRRALGDSLKISVFAISVLPARSRLLRPILSMGGGTELKYGLGAIVLFGLWFSTA